MSRWQNKHKKPPPAGYDQIAPILSALENELRDKVKESNVGQRDTESLWPVHQIQHQRTRYIYDMYHTHKQISRAVYDHCVKMKLADAALIAKWKKPGYERLCSTYVINPSNYKFGTVSICRVPLWNRNEGQMTAQDPTTGCFGCASGKGAAPKNIFGNKYGQNLAAVQIARERRMQEIREAKMTKERETVAQAVDEGGDEVPVAAAATGPVGEEGGSETEDDSDDSDDDDYGPTPEAGVWAGSRRLERESQRIAGEEEEEEEEEGPQPPPKKLRAS